MIDKSFLVEIGKTCEFEFTEQELEKFDLYAQMLVDWNEKVNLTAITEPTDICVKHFLDSLLLLRAVEVKQNARLLDVGAGAGFPSIPCGIVRPDLKLTLLDSLNKRVKFLEELSDKLEINTNCIHGRAEEIGKLLDFREKYDIVTARAVAHLRELSEYCLPFVKLGGFFATLKGFDIENELDEAKTAIKLLGGKLISVEKYSIYGGNKRSIVIIQKISQTPTKYPRISSKMKKQPL